MQPVPLDKTCRKRAVDPGQRAFEQSREISCLGDKKLFPRKRMPVLLDFPRKMRTQRIPDKALRRGDPQQNHDRNPGLCEHAIMHLSMPYRSLSHSDVKGMASKGGEKVEDRFGCCPHCRTFVRIGPADPSGEPSDCPACRCPILELEALWPDEPGRI
jgi:hypothetical protein